jgi:hypothetical protein
MRNTSRLAVAIAFILVGLGCGRRVEWLFPPEPQGPRADNRTLAIWYVALRQSEARPTAFAPILRSGGDRVDTLPLVLVTGDLDRPTPWPPQWLAQLVADGTIDGICGTYVRISCPEYTKARWIHLGEVSFTHADSARARMQLMVQTRSLCGRGADGIAWTTEFRVAARGLVWEVVSDSVFAIQDVRCEVEVRRPAP